MAISRYSSFSVVFPFFRPTFLSLGPFLGATPLREKENRYSESKFYAGHFEKKKNFNISKNKKARPTLKTFGGAISSHLISFRFLPFSGHFRTVLEHQKRLIGSRKMWFNWRKKSDKYLKRNEFYSGSKTILISLFRYI